MRSDPSRSERELEADAVRRMDQNRQRRVDAELETGRYAEPRSWMARTRDEVASWFGVTGAMRRRQWDEAAGDHSGKGPMRQVDEDTRILDRLNQSLTVDRELDASAVRASVEDGVVTLEGSVPSWAGVQRAEGLASAISGVRQVVNKLAVV